MIASKPFTSNDIRRRLGSLVTRFADEAYRESEAGLSTPRGTGASVLTEYLGLLIAGASPSDLATVKPDLVGFGSRVRVQDVQTGESRTLCLMASQAIGNADDQVSLESPIGAGLLGKGTGDIIDVRTPTGPRSFRVLSVHTLLDLLEVLDPQDGDLMPMGGH